jgi:hypothetical protein
MCRKCLETKKKALVLLRGLEISYHAAEISPYTHYMTKGEEHNKEKNIKKSE